MNTMSSWSFIVENITFSFSSVTSFETCKGGWKLNYIDKKDGISNFFAQYGNLIHDCLEKYFRRELDSFELSEYYRTTYDTVITASPPTYPAGMADNYREQGQDFFDRFFYPIGDYDVLAVEASASFIIPFAGREVKFIAKPDLLLKEKSTGKVFLIDFKTSNPFRKYKDTRVEDKRKTEGYYKQLYVYAHAIRETMGVNVDVMSLWFPRMDAFLNKTWNEFDELETLNWLKSGIENILAEEDFSYNKSNEYFCMNLCSVRHLCPMWGGKGD